MGRLTGYGPSSWPLILLSLTAFAILSYQIIAMYPLPAISGHRPPATDTESCSGIFDDGARRRREVMSVEDFGGVGDGRTSNTAAFRRAVEYMQRFSGDGEAQLDVPRGRWLTGSFNLTSNFTLFLQEGALILGSQARTVLPVLYALFKLKYLNGWNKGSTVSKLPIQTCSGGQLLGVSAVMHNQVSRD